MAEPLHLIVQTPDKTLLDAANLLSIQVQLADGGGIGILPGHAPLLGETAAGTLTYADETDEHTVELAAGILQIARGNVTIFTSGPAQEPPPTQTPDADQKHFDRLASALLTTLNASPEGVMGGRDDEETADSG